MLDKWGVLRYCFGMTYLPRDILGNMQELTRWRVILTLNA